MYKQTQWFNFDANAEEVFAFLLQSGQNREHTDGEHTFVCAVAPEFDYDSVIMVTMDVGLICARSKNEGAEGLDSERTSHLCAKVQLRLFQTRPAACLGKLFIDVIDPSSAATSLGLTVGQAEAAIRSFIGGRWRRMIACWEDHRGRSVAAHTAKTARLRGGRPRSPDDDWAYEQVVVLGRPRPDVYREWQARIGERAKLLADPLHTFNQAIAVRIKKPPEKSIMAVS